MELSEAVQVVIRFQICIFDILNTAKCRINVWTRWL